MECQCTVISFFWWLVPVVFFREVGKVVEAGECEDMYCFGWIKFLIDFISISKIICVSGMDDENTAITTLKILIIGESGVGKSRLVTLEWF